MSQDKDHKLRWLGPHSAESPADKAEARAKLKSQVDEWLAAGGQITRLVGAGGSTSAEPSAPRSRGADWRKQESLRRQQEPPTRG